jgi:hypothetical protein
MKFLNWLARSATKHPEDLAILGFDPDFYLARYADLKDLKDPQALRRHYLLHGKSEGRFGSLSQAVSYLERSYGKLPSDFDPEEYRAAHRDLAEMPAWEAVEHYLRYGQQEGRFYFRFNCEIYRELYFANQIIFR